MRLLIILLRAWWATRKRRWLATDAVTVLEMRVWPQDIDLNLHMNNARYFSIADMGRFDWWMRTGIWRRALARGWRPVAGDVDARFSRSLQPFQRYQLATQLVGWDAKWIYALHEFKVGPKTYATLAVRYVFIRGKRDLATPKQVLALAGVEGPSPPLPEWVRQWSGAQDRLAADRRALRYAEQNGDNSNVD